MTVKTLVICGATLCSSCATTQLQTVTVPVPVKCIETAPKLPTLDKIEQHLAMYEQVRMLLIQRAELRAYALEADALLQECSK